MTANRNDVGSRKDGNQDARKLRKDGQPKRKPGRKPGAGPGGPRAYQEPAAHMGGGGPPSDGPADNAPARDDQGRILRRNNTPVPIIVEKMISVIREDRHERDRTEKALGLSTYKFYAWETISGAPTTAQAISIANHLDISLEYLIDDTIPLRVPHPRRDNGPTARLANSLAVQGMSVEQVERYIVSLMMAITFNITPDQLSRIVMAAITERGEFLKGQARRPTIDGPASHLEGPTEGEKRAAQAAENEEHRRRNGGPKPKTAG